MDTFRRKSRKVAEANSTNRDENVENSNAKRNEINLGSLSSDVKNLSLNNDPYLQNQFAILTPALSRSNIGELIRKPNGVDKNEWIAINFVSFYNHVSGLCSALSDLCTAKTCPLMTGPKKSVYYWNDERGKKVKCSALQYVDLSMTFIQKTLSNETIFPTRLDKKFPSTFEMLIVKMFRLLYHCLSHIYAFHYINLIGYELHPHLNSLFLHIISFILKCEIIPSDMNSSNNLSISHQNETRELRTEIDPLSPLYELLSKQWYHTYAQASAQKNSIINH